MERLRNKKEGLIEESKKILQGYFDAITLRQLYYRLVSKDLIENKQSQYQYLSKALKEGRLSGRIPFSSIEDRTREANGGDYHYLEPEERLRFAWDNFTDVVDRQRRPQWEGQDYYIEVWVEKQALENIFNSIANRKGVTSFACRGYAGWTSLKEAEERFRNHPDKEKKIIYYGDFDPSGKDIERFIQESMRDVFGMHIQVERVALTKDQIDEYELPPQPAKRSDARYEDFVAKHGDMAVELDALDPELLEDMIEESINEYWDEDYYYNEVKPKEEEEKEWINEKVQEMKKAVDVNIEEE